MSALVTESLPNEGVRLRDEHEQRSLLNHADATILQAVVKIDASASVTFRFPRDFRSPLPHSPRQSPQKQMWMKFLCFIEQ